MGKDSDREEAFGGPGIPPRWTHAAKDGVGTAYASSSRLWFTLWNGIVTEVYYPTVDRPQLRDLQFLVTDGETFFHEEKRHLRSMTERLSHHVLGYRITNTDPEGRYSLVKEVLSDPHLPCLLVNTILSGEEPFLKRLRLYALCAPHLGMGGWGNNARVMEIAGRKILTAEKDGVWLALAATVPFSRLSCGYVGRSDGWTDLAVDYRMDWEFDRATDGTSPSPANWTLATDGSSRWGSLSAMASTALRPRSWNPSPFPSRSTGNGSRNSGTGHVGGSFRSKRRRPTAGTCITGATASFSPTRTKPSPGLHRFAVHPVGRSQGRQGPGRIPPCLDEGHGQHRHGPPRRGEHRVALARPDLPGRKPARRRRVFPELLDRRRAVLAGDPARRGGVPHPAWRGACCARATSGTSTPIRW